MVFLIYLILALAVAVLDNKRLPCLLALPQQAFIPCRCMGCLCSRLWAEFRLSHAFLRDEMKQFSGVCVSHGQCQLEHEMFLIGLCV